MINCSSKCKFTCYCNFSGSRRCKQVVVRWSKKSKAQILTLSTLCVLK